MWIARFEKPPELTSPDVLKLRVTFSDGKRSLEKLYELDVDGIVSIDTVCSIITTDLARIQKLDALRNQLLARTGQPIQ